MQFSKAITSVKIGSKIKKKNCAFTVPRVFSLSEQEQGKILAFKDQNLKFREV